MAPVVPKEGHENGWKSAHSAKYKRVIPQILGDKVNRTQKGSAAGGDEWNIPEGATTLRGLTTAHGAATSKGSATSFGITSTPPGG